MRDDGCEASRGPDRTLLQPQLQGPVVAIVAIVAVVCVVSMIMLAGIEQAGRQPVGADHQPVAAGQVGRHEPGWTDQLGEHGQHRQTIRQAAPASIGDQYSHAIDDTTLPANWQSQ